MWRDVMFRFFYFIGILMWRIFMAEKISKISSNPSYMTGTGADCSAMSALAGGDLTSMKNQRHIGEISESGGMAEILCDSTNRRWGFTPAIKILECTLRDGGNVNGSRFDEGLARRIVECADGAGADIIEVGYKNSDKFCRRTQFGKFRFCDEDLIKRITEGVSAEISVLVDCGRCEPAAFLPAGQSAVDLVRCAFYARDSAEALRVLAVLKDKGYKTAACMMAASTIGESLGEKVAEIAGSSAVDIVYLMDSYGALLPDEFAGMAKMYGAVCAENGKLFGVHSHDNLQCAFANELAGISAGARIADCTIGGLGNGAGNCRAELLFGILRGADAAARIAEFAQREIEPIKAKFGCAPYPKYMLAALANTKVRK